MAKNSSLGLSGHMSQAVSDGELNMSARGCGGSSSSLPATSGGAGDPDNSVLRWAVSFEKLLEDPCGVRYFTAFLMSEVSAENILFWQACEKFKKIPATSLNELKTAACSIYNMYLSDSAPYSVNIDDTAKIEEKDLEQPVPDMFNKAQTQIFKLMKMDSFRRFVRSSLYQSCTLASVEGKHLPPLSAEPADGSWDNVTRRSPPSDKKNRRSSPLALDDGVRGRLGVEGGYCCMYLPDGSASLAPTRPGQPIREMLLSLCEKRGFPLKDVIIYLHGKEKQPLSLDQDCSVLRDQQVTLELRVTFALEIAFTGKSVGIMAKSSKTLQDALSAVLQKHHLKLQDVQLTMVGSDAPVNMSTSVFKLANKTLRLDKVKEKEQTNISRGSSNITATQATTVNEVDVVARSHSLTDRPKAQPKPRLLDMLTRAQCCRVDDQRGLLTKEQLEIPLFLQLPSGPRQENSGENYSALDPKDSEKKDSLSASSASTAKEPPDSKCVTKDLKESKV